MANEDLQTAPLEELIVKCNYESEQYRHFQTTELRHCFELFRRALEQQDQQAWTFIYEFYERQVIIWVNRHPVFAGCKEEPQYFVNGAFWKFRRAIKPTDYSQKFESLGAVLQLLKMCVASELLDYRRKDKESELITSLVDKIEMNVRSADTLELPASQETAANKTWEMISGELTNELEVMVAESSFLYEMTAAQIFASYPAKFSDVKQIYRIKENILKRLRRNPELRRANEEWRN